MILALVERVPMSEVVSGDFLLLNTGMVVVDEVGEAQGVVMIVLDDGRELVGDRSDEVNVLSGLKSTGGS